MNQSYSSGTSCVFHARHWLEFKSAMAGNAAVVQWLVFLSWFAAAVHSA
jgi:hypothetical protein